MKKFYIPVLAAIIAFGSFGCEKKTDNGAMDSAIAPAKTGGHSLTNPSTTQIMPPAVGTGGNLKITLPQGGNSVDFYVFFVVANSAVVQTVTIGANGPYTSGARSGPAMAAPVPYVAPATVLVTASLSAGAYSAGSIPSNVAQTDGWDVTTYDDGSGNKAIIAVMDMGQ